MNKSYSFVFIIFKYFCWQITKIPGTYFVNFNKTTWAKFWFIPCRNVAHHQLQQASNNPFPRWLNSTCAIPLGHCITCKQSLRDGRGKSKGLPLMRFEQGGLSLHLTWGRSLILCFTTALRNTQKSTLGITKCISQCSQCYFAAQGALKGAQR